MKFYITEIDDKINNKKYFLTHNGEKEEKNSPSVSNIFSDLNDLNTSFDMLHHKIINITTPYKYTIRTLEIDFSNDEVINEVKQLWKITYKDK